MAINYFDQRAHLAKIGAKGGLAVMAKYGRVGGDERRRKEAWLRWWQRTGQYQESKILYKRKKIKYPKRSAKLAEFVGILMGDGGISQRQVVITLHSRTELEYAAYVVKLIKKLFGVVASLNYSKRFHAVDVTISSTSLVEFCQSIGLKIGNKIKQHIDVPIWIKEDAKFSRYCLRGLVDTDGSIFNHRYRSAGKWYVYKKIDFCSLSKELICSANRIFKANDMKPYLNRGKILRLESQKDVIHYFKVIGTSNPKHLRRYEE